MIAGKMMTHVSLSKGAELRVDLDHPPESIRRVMFFESGFPWMGQHPLAFDQQNRCWTATVTPGTGRGSRKTRTSTSGPRIPRASAASISP